jgi:hypothetical protein
VNGSCPNVCGPSLGVFVAPNVLRLGRGTPSVVRVPGDGPPVADAVVDADAGGVAAIVPVGPDATDGVALTGPD